MASAPRLGKAAVYVLSVVALAAPSLGTSLSSAYVGQYSEYIEYSAGCGYCVLSPIASSDRAGFIRGSRGESSPSFAFTVDGNAGSLVALTSAPTLTPPLALDPEVTADAKLSLSGGANPDLEDSATMTYYVEISSKTSGFPVPSQLPANSVHLQVDGSVLTEGDAYASAAFVLGGAISDRKFINSSVGQSKSDGFHFDSYLSSLYDNTVYQIAIAAAAGVAGGDGPGNMEGSASVDPVFTIAPQYQGLYEIELSPDLEALAGPPPAAVPEPAVTWLMLFCLIAGYCWHRRVNLGGKAARLLFRSSRAHRVD